jgi:hypothetical protein
MLGIAVTQAKMACNFDMHEHTYRCSNLYAFTDFESTKFSH